MKTKLALVSAPVSLEERYGALAGAASTEPSFALVMLAAVALREDAEVRIIEASARNLTVEETVDEIRSFAPDIVGLTATTVGIRAAGEVAAWIKAVNPNTLILVGGCHISALPIETMSAFPAFDLGVLGEGELTLTEILRHHRHDPVQPVGLAGTVERTTDEIRVNPPRPLIGNLDELPLPAWHLLPGFPKSFRPSPARIKRWPCASVVLTRGCPNRCTFCDRSVFGNRCRGYSPSYAVELLKDLRTRYGVREVLIEDDTFVIRRDTMQEFCERLISERVDVTWSCLGRADRVTPELLRLMKKAGCWHVSFGVESGDPEILRSVNKRLDVEEIREAVSWCRDAGLMTKGFFMIGFPGETRDSIEATRQLACALPLDDISVMQLTPFPGSDLYKTARQFGTFEEDWSRMNALNTVFIPKGFTREELDEARARMLRSFYLRPRVLARYAWRLLLRPRLGLRLLPAFSAFLRSAFPTRSRLS